jgi:hypothetical protein
MAAEQAALTPLPFHASLIFFSANALLSIFGLSESFTDKAAMTRQRSTATTRQANASRTTASPLSFAESRRP